MNINDLEKEYKLRIKRDTCGECGEYYIPSKHGQIYEQGSGLFGVMVLGSSARRWESIKRKLTGEGFTLRQNGDSEGRYSSTAATRGSGRRPYVLRALFGFDGSHGPLDSSIKWPRPPQKWGLTALKSFEKRRVVSRYGSAKTDAKKWPETP